MLMKIMFLIQWQLTLICSVCLFVFFSKPLNSNQWNVFPVEFCKKFWMLTLFPAKWLKLLLQQQLYIFLLEVIRAKF